MRKWKDEDEIECDNDVQGIHRNQPKRKENRNRNFPKTNSRVDEKAILSQFSIYLFSFHVDNQFLLSFTSFLYVIGWYVMRFW